ncbi:protein of unknown function [Paraburkholderia dioscoreae]|uniref:Uncharacterized protein n=1 Tax=Paraburkholderia dioscoreae TaxID=2604047 RepID=A0A5Q4ZEV1_9BURK|nr:protein of unknown function [Paraburkholderia dioscoreae]
MLARHVGKTVGIVVQIRNHFLRLALAVEHDMAHLDRVEFRRIQREVILDSGLVADLVEHLLLIQSVGNESLELVETDVERVEVLIHIRRAMQAAHAAELIGALLDFVGAHGYALLLRRVNRELVAHDLLDQAFELAGQFQKANELAHVHDFVIDSHYRGHFIRSFN